MWGILALFSISLLYLTISSLSYEFNGKLQKSCFTANLCNVTETVSTRLLIEYNQQTMVLGFCWLACIPNLRNISDVA